MEIQLSICLNRGSRRLGRREIPDQATKKAAGGEHGNGKRNSDWRATRGSGRNR